MIQLETIILLIVLVGGFLTTYVFWAVFNSINKIGKIVNVNAKVNNVNFDNAKRLFNKTNKRIDNLTKSTKKTFGLADDNFKELAQLIEINTELIIDLQPKKKKVVNKKKSKSSTKGKK